MAPSLLVGGGVGGVQKRYMVRPAASILNASLINGCDEQSACRPTNVKNLSPFSYEDHSTLWLDSIENNTGPHEAFSKLLGPEAIPVGSDPICPNLIIVRRAAILPVVFSIDSKALL